MILLVCAVAQELQWFSPRPDVEVLVTGVGPVEAAARVAQFLTTHSYQLVVNVGIAGAFAGVGKIGEGVVVSEETIQLDIEDGSPIQLPTGAQTIARVHSDAELVMRVVSRGFRVVRGITVARVTATDRTATRLRTLGVEVESMEGFAVLRAAEIAGARAIEVRGISNYVGDRAKSGWDFSAGIVGLRGVTEALLAEFELNA